MIKLHNDFLIQNYINQEEIRQKNNIELIPSENYPSEDILAVLGSCLQNKYSEGYPTERTTGNKGRYYGGCSNIDLIEQLCCERWQKVFHTDYHVNVQPHSGSQANAAAYMAVLNPGDLILAADWTLGAHLTHGSLVNFSGKIYNIKTYTCDKNGYIDYEDIAKKIEKYHPKLLVVGGSAYSRTIDFKKIYNIINSSIIKPYYLVDMAHLAGLIAADCHNSPFGYADIITTTTHKTLRGPRGGMIFCKTELAKKIDSAVFPGTQGGPLENVIAAKAVCAKEVMTEEYKIYIQQVIKNTKIMCDEFIAAGFDIVSGGTDNHMFIINFKKTNPEITGLQVQNLLDKYNITVNKQLVPFDNRSPRETSGIRLGCAAMTTLGWTENEAKKYAQQIISILKKELL